jgi:hypothetical protein
MLTSKLGMGGGGGGGGGACRTIAIEKSIISVLSRSSDPAETNLILIFFDGSRNRDSRPGSHRRRRRRRRRIIPVVLVLGLALSLRFWHSRRQGRRGRWRWGRNVFFLFLFLRRRCRRRGRGSGGAVSERLCTGVVGRDRHLAHSYRFAEQSHPCQCVVMMPSNTVANDIPSVAACSSDSLCFLASACLSLQVNFFPGVGPEATLEGALLEAEPPINALLAALNPPALGFSSGLSSSSLLLKAP